ncbi:methyltransferase-like protein 4 [Galendromus occidentalis]|uniref:Methyltransferase-like protein 4 n=1 Tax=Galendromus occidentalis TaxID=34638 RepID=A0AAJ6W039_9ACAR|nr:methyltransferase-like protein 4 [Galendromus occidentalis]
MDHVIFLDHRRSSKLSSGRADLLLKEELFAISTEFAAIPGDDDPKKGKSKRSCPEFADATADWQSDATIEKKLRDFVKSKPELFVSEPQRDSDRLNMAAKAAAASCPSAFFFQGCESTTFAEVSGRSETLIFQKREFILPPMSRGILGSLDVDLTTPKLLEAAEDLYGSEGKYDIIVMDPPWMNKSVKRQRRYMTESAEDILSRVPIPNLLHDDGLLVVWYTHNERHYRQLKDHLAHWNLRILANWTWLKVTTSGKEICPFGRNFKKPYEHLLLAARPDATFSAKSIESDQLILVSVPSAVHSHKPNLDEVLDIIFGANWNKPRRLELFARALKSNWVCAGNEVIKLQSRNLFSSEILT